jgi:hypothetical protein
MPRHGRAGALGQGSEAARDTSSDKSSIGSGRYRGRAHRQRPWAACGFEQRELDVSAKQYRSFLKKSSKDFYVAVADYQESGGHAAPRLNELFWSRGIPTSTDSALRAC